MYAQRTIKRTIQNKILQHNTQLEDNKHEDTTDLHSFLSHQNPALACLASLGLHTVQQCCSDNYPPHISLEKPNEVKYLSSASWVIAFSSMRYLHFVHIYQMVGFVIQLVTSTSLLTSHHVFPCSLIINRRKEYCFYLMF